jgi:hypothetical protein
MQRMVQSMTPKKKKIMTILDLKVKPTMALSGDQAAQSQPTGATLKALVSKMAQDGPE